MPLISQCIFAVLVGSAIGLTLNRRWIGSTILLKTVRIERKLDRILAHLGLEIERPIDDVIFQLAITGRKIQAIKEYRKQTGASLAVATSEVERMLRDRPSPTQTVTDHDI